MLTIESLIAVLSFGLTCFGLGYTLGTKSRKNNRPRSGKLRRLFYQISMRTNRLSVAPFVVSS